MTVQNEAKKILSSAFCALYSLYLKRSFAPLPFPAKSVKARGTVASPTNSPSGPGYSANSHLQYLQAINGRTMIEFGSNLMTPPSPPPTQCRCEVDTTDVNETCSRYLWLVIDHRHQ